MQYRKRRKEGLFSLKRLMRIKRIKPIVSCLLLIALFTTTAAPAFSAKETDTDIDLQLRELREQLQHFLAVNGEEMEGGQQPILSNPAAPFDMTASSTAGDNIQRISVPIPGISERGGGGFASINSDGRYIAFREKDSNNILYYDSQSQETKRITTGFDGEGANSTSYRPVISMEGRYVLFASSATNLDPGQTGNGASLFLYDHVKGSLRRIAQGIPAGNENHTPYAVSAGGRYIAFSAQYHPAGGPDDNPVNLDLYYMDTITEDIRRIASDVNGSDVSLSADGRYLAFTTNRKHPVEGLDADSINRLFVYDVHTDQFESIARTADGQAGNISVISSSLSPDGRYVIFNTPAAGIAGGDSGYTVDLFVHDRNTDDTRLVEPLATDSGSYGKRNPGISAGGRYVTYTVKSENLTVTDQVYMSDMVDGQSFLVSAAPQGGPANYHSGFPSVSAGGRFIAFESMARDLLAEPEPDITLDVFRKDLSSMIEAVPPPLWPQGASVSVTQKGASYVLLEWPEAAGEQGAIFYKVYKDGQLLDLVRENKYLARELAPASSYSFRVEAGNQHFSWNEGLPAINVTTEAVPELAAPGVVGGLSVIPDYARLKVAWTGPSDEDLTEVRVLWRKIGNEAFRETRIRPGIGKVFLDGLMNRTAYELKVKTIDADGNAAETPLTQAMTAHGPVVARPSEAFDGMSGNGESRNVSISSDGRYMVFETDAYNLVNGSLNGTKVILHDRFLGTNRVVHRKANGSPTEGGYLSHLSSNGRYILYFSVSNEVAGIEGKGMGYVLHDRDSDGNGVFDENGGTSNRYLGVPDGYAFDFNHAVNASPIVEGSPPVVSVTSSYTDFSTGKVIKKLFILDFSQEKWVTPKTVSGLEPNANSYAAGISGNGEWLAFYTESTNLDFNDSNGGAPSLYLYHIPSRTFKFAAVSQSVIAFSGRPSVDETGRYIAAAALRENEYLYQIYLFDRVERKGELVSRGLDGTLGNGTSSMPDISPDGRYVAFMSGPSNLVSNPNVGVFNLYLWNREDKSITAPLRSYDDSLAKGSSSYPSLNGDGSLMAFSSEANNLIRNDMPYGQDVFWTLTREVIQPVPMWPQDSMLEAVNIGRNEVTLRWTSAQAEQGILKYRIAYGDGQQILVDGDATEWTVEGLDPDTSYLFGVQATADGDRWTSDGPSVTVKTLPVTGGSEAKVDEIRVSAPSRYKATLPREASLGIVLTGTPDGLAEAAADYETTGREHVQASVPLQETAPGRYEGIWRVPGDVRQIASIQGSLKAGSSTARKEALVQPIEIGGSLKITANTPYADKLQGSVAAVFSASSGLNDAKPFNPEGTVFNGLPASGDYRVQLRSAEGLPLLEGSGSAAEAAAGEERQLVLTPRFPAYVDLRVMAPDGKGVPYARVMVKGSDGRTIKIGLTLGDGSLQERISGLYAGERLTIEGNDPKGNYAESGMTMTLEPGLNEAAVTLKTIVPVTLSGTVKDSDGVLVAGALVNVSQSRMGYPGFYQTKTDENGNYSLFAYNGKATVNASFKEAGSTIPVVLDLSAEEENRHHFQLENPIPSFVNVKLYTKHIGGQWAGPLELDWRTSIHFHVRLSSPSAGNSNPYPIKAVPGESVTVCLDGYESGLPKACETAVVGPNKQASVEFHLEEKGGKIEGTLPESIQALPKWLTVYRLSDDGSRKHVRSVGASGEWSVTVPEAGTYQLEFSTHSYPRMFAQKTVEVGLGEQVDLGLITLTEDRGIFAGRTGNEVSLRQKDVSADTPLDVIVRYENGVGHPVTDAELWLEVPAGTRLDEEAGIYLDGSKVHFRAESGGVVVPVGAVQAGERGIATYRLRAAQLPDGERVDVSARMQYTMQGSVNTEHLGTDTAFAARLTMEAPEITGRADLIVSGKAPAGSGVRVYDDGQLLGEVKAFTDGSWRLPVRLATEDPGSDHNLWAEALRGTERWTKSGMKVRYDSRHVEIVKMTMRQSDGRTVSFDPAEGIAKFPYVYAPDRPFIFGIRFTRPEMVDNVQVTVGSVTAKAYPGPDGEHAAVLSPSGTGPIYVHYDTAKLPLSFESFEPSLESVLKDAPAQWRDVSLQTVYVTPESSPSPERTITMKGVLPVQGGGLDFNTSVSVQTVEGYVPSEQDLAKAAKTGIPLYGLKLTPIRGNSALTISVSGYFEKDMLDRLGTEGAVLAMLGNPAAFKKQGIKKEVHTLAVKQFVKVSFEVVAKGLQELLEPGENLWEKFEKIHALLDGYGLKDIFENLDKLEQLLRYVEEHCPPEDAKRFMRDIDRLFQDIIILEITKAFMDVAVAGLSYALGGLTLGLSILVFFAVDICLDEALEIAFDTEIDEVRHGVDKYCRKEKGEKKADPVWIHDPSGYVYEVEPSNRVEGVQATVMQKNEADGNWGIWDASWFEQVNPQTTDGEGRYGWFVPDGLWKVHYEKDGYLPAESAELRVLPPHFDVNVPIVSTLPSKVAYIRPAPGGAHVDIWFDRHVLLETANEYTVNVRTSDEETVAGRVEAVNSVEWNGKTVTRRLRFIPEPDAALEIGRTYELLVTSGIQSYNGIPAGEDFSRDFTVTERDESAPSPVEDASIYAGEDHIILHWEDPTDPDFDHVEISWSMSGDEAVGGTVNVLKGAGWTKLDGLQANSSYKLVIRSVDGDGNASDLPLTAGTAELPGIEPDLVPPAPVTDLAVEPGIRTLEVTWSDSTGTDAESAVLRWMKTGEEEELGSAKIETGKEVYTIEGLAPNTEYTVTVSAADKEGNESFAVGLETKTKTDQSGGTPSQGGGGYMPPLHPEAGDEWTVGPEGGEWSAFGGKLRIRVPEGAVARSVVWNVRELDSSEAEAGPAYKIFSGIYEISLSSDAALLKPVLLSVTLKPLLGTDPRKLILYKETGETSGWSPVGGWAEEMNLETSISGSGIYSVMARNRSFNDLAGHWSRQEVEVLASREIVDGVTGNEFQPNRSITRAEFVKLLAGWKGADIPAGSGKEQVFTDVHPENWHYEAVGLASRLGWVQGAGGKFRPNDPVTREEMAVILHRNSVLSNRIRLDP